jgi:hypothetical protein
MACGCKGNSQTQTPKPVNKPNTGTNTPVANPRTVQASRRTIIRTN